MNKINYQLELDHEIDEIKKQGRVPSLLLHSCCGPCSSYVLEYLTKYFDVTVLYFNPNIYPAEEYEHRLSEQRRIISLLPAEHSVKMLECEYNHTQFTDAAKGQPRGFIGRHAGIDQHRLVAADGVESKGRAGIVHLADFAVRH